MLDRRGKAARLPEGIEVFEAGLALDAEIKGTASGLLIIDLGEVEPHRVLPGRKGDAVGGDSVVGGKSALGAVDLLDTGAANRARVGVSGK